MSTNYVTFCLYLGIIILLATNSVECLIPPFPSSLAGFLAGGLLLLLLGLLVFLLLLGGIRGVEEMAGRRVVGCGDGWQCIFGGYFNLSVKATIKTFA